MAENSKIQWTTHTFNAWRGCTKISEGCTNCYADTLSKRNPGTLGIWGPKGTRVVASEAMWREPIKWDLWAKEGVCPNCHGKSTRQTPGRCRACDGSGNVGPYRARVFCASLADVFEDWQGAMVDSDGNRGIIWPDGGEAWTPAKREPDEGDEYRWLTMNDVRARLFGLIDDTPNLDWLLLTKRPENIQRMMPQMLCTRCFGGPCDPNCPEKNRVRPNVWLGTSVENQETADERIPHLLGVQAAVRFLSVEPLLGPIDLSPSLTRCECGAGFVRGANGHTPACATYQPGIDWVIIGGESGHGARPCWVEWVRSIVAQCQAAGVAVFVKQLGRHPVDMEFAFADSKGGDIAEWPADLQIREMPR